MTRRVAVGVLAAVLAALVAGMAPAAAARGASGPGGDGGGMRIESTDTSDYPRLEATVVAPRALVDHELSADEVTVTENGQPRQAEVTRIPGAGQQIVVAVDVSGSMAGDAIDAAKDAAATFVDGVPNDAEVALVAFAGTPEVVEPLTADTRDVRRAVGRLRADGHTALYDAVVAATRLFDDDPEVRRSLIVLSDGADTASAASLEQAGARLADAEVNLAVVELVTAATDRDALERLAGHVDGRVLTAARPDELAELYDGAAVDLGNRYQVQWRSSSYDRTELGVEIDAAGVSQRTGGYLLELPTAPWWNDALSSPAGMAAGLLAVWGALGLVAVPAIRRNTATVGRHRLLGPTKAARRSALAGLTGRAVGAAESGLGRRNLLDRLAVALDAAGIRKTPGEFVVMCASAAATAAAVGLLLGGPLLMVVLAGVGLLVPKMVLSFATSRRQAAFADQLEPTLQLLAGSLRAGHSLLQAVDAVTREAEEPTAAEFRRIVNATRVGRDLSDALDETCERMGSEDFRWIAQAIAIHREVGGNLADVLDTVAGTIRERNQIRRQVKALSAEGKLSAVVLMALPVGIVGFLSVANPEYLSGFFTNGFIGYAMIAVALMMLTVGGLWMRKTVRIEF